MNIFLIEPDFNASAIKLFERDKLRANKQILECAQLLAFFEINHIGWTSILKADGTPYKATKAQLNHPISKHMLSHRSEYDLCWNVFQGLIAVKPNHACARSVKLNRNWLIDDNTEYIVCRKDHPIVYVNNLEEYSKLMLEYLINFKWIQ